ncbi:tlh3 [Purpureocillium lilacinum]|uniref:Tlh3 n=1 Tax=Purpureocillium lilacinum TaxID=33203 RepID=A0A179G1W6_PURLI|nr:tlh3 [Purpureocillium lilacinum]OAQ71876.1 tlh3 [Purpureocillium lilacinum]
MLHVRYHKSQEMTEKPADNIRFLPRAVGDLLLTYLAVVQPLRQTFLRQSKPGALLSPYLWATLGGEVWSDGRVVACLKRACARAETPRLTVAWWRQAAASITKAKLSPSQRANFNIHDMEGPEEIEEEFDVVSLAVASNHSVGTFNTAYAGTTTLVMNMPLNRAYRASEIWRNLLGVDQALRAKRPRVPAGDDDPYARGGILNACKKVQLRRRPALKRGGLVAVARRLYNDPALQLRRPGQEKAMLAVLGPRPAEQVVVVLGTGSGKSLLFMVAAAMDGAGTTVLVLPAVALRTNMLDRLRKAGVRYREWHPGSSNKAAPLVIVSAEAACTERFVEYVSLLNSRQQLDRIVVDECHLTVTASNYRRSMSQLGWYVRSVPTQTVWLTATLPPVFEEPFFEHNKLVRPLVVRESTDRPNIRYVVRCERGQGTLAARAAGCVRGFWGRKDLVQGERDRVVLYCQTKELVAELATLLDCPHYTGDDDDGRMDALDRWLGSAAMPAMLPRMPSALASTTRTCEKKKRRLFHASTSTNLESDGM